MSLRVVGPGGSSTTIIQNAVEVYGPKGDIELASSIPEGRYVIAGPSDLTGGGSFQSHSDVPPGDYTISYAAVEGYLAPPNETLTLADGGTLQFSGSYTSAADLVVDSVSFDDTVIYSEEVQIQLSGNLGNLGNQVISNVPCEVRIGSTADWDTATSLGTFTVPGPVTKGALSPWQGSFVAPNSLVPGSYYVAVRIDPSGTLAESIQFNNLWWSPTANLNMAGTVPLLPPTNIWASDGTYGDKVLVTWDASSGATHYRVYRRAVGSSIEPVGPWQSGTSFEDTTAVPGTTYAYWVRAGTQTPSGLIRSDYSISDSGYRVGLPTNVAATDGFFTDKVRVTWDASRGATHYRVYRRTIGTSVEAVTSWQTGRVFDDIDVVPGTVYAYWVRAAHNNNPGLSPTDFSEFPDSGYSALAPPTGLAASDGTLSNKVRVIWNASNGATHYQLYRRSPGTSVQPVSSWQTELSFFDHTAVSGTIYKYWVKAAKNSSGQGRSGFSVPDRGSPARNSNNVAATDGVGDQKKLAKEEAATNANESGYDTWAAKFPGMPVGQLGRSDDPDGDGVVNALEMFYGSSPVDASDKGGITVIPATAEQPMKLRLQVAKTIPSGVAQLSWSADQVNWQAAGKLTNGVNVTFSEEVIDESHANYDVVEITATVTYGAPDHLYLKLDVDEDAL